MSDRPLGEVVEAMLAHDEAAISEFLSRQPAAEVPVFVHAAKLLGEKGMHALSSDPAAFMRFKCPETTPTVDKALFRAGVEAAKRVGGSGDPEERMAAAQEVDALLGPLSMNDRYAVASLGTRIGFVWSLGMRFSTRVAQTTAAGDAA